MFSIFASTVGGFIVLLVTDQLRNEYNKRLVSEDGRQQVSNALKSLGTEKYSNLLSKTLDQIDQGLSPSKHDKPESSVPAIAWSAGTMRLSLRLAVLYPILFMVTQWALFGFEIAIVGETIFPEQDMLSWRVIVLLMFMTTLVFYPTEGEHQSAFGVPRQQLELNLGADAPSENEGKPLSAIFRTGMIPLLLFGAVLAFGGRSEIIVGFLAIVLAARASGLVAISLTVPIALFVSHQMSWFFPITILITLAFVLQSRVGKRLDRPLLFVFLYLSSLLLFLVFWLVFAANPDDGTAILVTLIAVFPILNTLFDFLSIGLTRACLRLGVQEKRPAFYGFIDIVMGSLIFLLLLSTMIAFFHYVRTSSGDPILPVSEFLLNGGDQAKGQLWFYASLATTLIPTLLHGFFAFLVATPILKLPLFGVALDRAAKALGSSKQDQANWVFTFGMITLVVTFGAFVWAIAEIALLIVPFVGQLSPVFQNFVAELVQFITGQTT